MKKKYLNILLIATLIFLISFTIINYKQYYINTISSKQAYVAIVIDDFGNNGSGTLEMLNLGIPITAAVMPFMPYTKEDSQRIHDAGMEIIMHVPLEPENGKQSWLGPKGITNSLSDSEIEYRLSEGLKQIQWAKGMNNHMGSKAMKDERIVNILMLIAKRYSLYFVDSKTCNSKLSLDISKQINIDYTSRDIFLDNIKKQNEIEKQLKKLGELALKKGYAIGIGHVGPEGGIITANAIKAVYPALLKQGIQFLSVSEIIKIFKALNNNCL